MPKPPLTNEEFLSQLLGSSNATSLAPKPDLSAGSTPNPFLVNDVANPNPTMTNLADQDTVIPGDSQKTQVGLGARSANRVIKAAPRTAVKFDPIVSKGLGIPAKKPGEFYLMNTVNALTQGDNVMDSGGQATIPQIESRNAYIGQPTDARWLEGIRNDPNLKPLAQNQEYLDSLRHRPDAGAATAHPADDALAGLKPKAPASQVVPGASKPVESSSGNANTGDSPDLASLAMDRGLQGGTLGHIADIMGHNIANPGKHYDNSLWENLDKEADAKRKAVIDNVGLDDPNSYQSQTMRTIAGNLGVPTTGNESARQLQQMMPMMGLQAKQTALESRQGLAEDRLAETMRHNQQMEGLMGALRSGRLDALGLSKIQAVGKINETANQHEFLASMIDSKISNLAHAFGISPQELQANPEAALAKAKNVPIGMTDKLLAESPFSPALQASKGAMNNIALGFDSSTVPGARLNAYLEKNANQNLRSGYQSRQQFNKEMGEVIKNMLIEKANAQGLSSQYKSALAQAGM